MKSLDFESMFEETEAAETSPGVMKTKFYASDFSSKTEAKVLLWCLRALEYLQKTNALYRVLDEHGRHNEAMTDLLGACAPLKLEVLPTDVTQLMEMLPHCLQQLRELELPKSAIERSIDAVEKRCGMTPAERRLLLFGITLHENELLERVMDRCFRKINSGLLFAVLAHLLDVPLKDLQTALRSDSFLSRAGLLRLDPRPVIGMDNAIDIGAGASETFEVADGDWDTIVSRSCVPARPSQLCRQDFAHMDNEWDLVMGYLKGCACERRAGANVLLFGPPGCGKTAFARTLLAASGLQGYELSAERLDGRSMGVHARRSCYRQASQYLQSERPGVIIVDEMDGLLETEESPMPGFRGGDTMSKAAANALLETNPVPTIWITNNPHGLDSAQLRRFDLVVAFRQPSRRKIRQLLETRLSDMGLSEEWFAGAAATCKLSPGLVNTMAQVAESVQRGTKQRPELERLLGTALRQRGIHIERRVTGAYRIEYCNAAPEPAALVHALERKEDARCLLHGATGTGKTAFARHMAVALDLEPRMVRPSDILDPYLGGTERNIAELFQPATAEDSLIVLDEFESFATDRRGARHNWQISQVNELLTQLEAYPGRVIACTNLVDCLDPAIRRRFQLKVELFSLTRQQRCELFREFCGKLGLGKVGKAQAERWMAGLKELAFGHLANAAEVASNLSGLTPEKFAGLLSREIEATNGRLARPIGFVH